MRVATATASQIAFQITSATIIITRRVVVVVFRRVAVHSASLELEVVTIEATAVCRAATNSRRIAATTRFTIVAVVDG